jgi:PTS system mannose-specific IIC component
MTAIAIFAAILAFILSELKFRGTAPAVAGAAAADADYDPLEDDDDL